MLNENKLTLRSKIRTPKIVTLFVSESYNVVIYLNSAYRMANSVGPDQTARGGRVVRWFWVNFQCRGVLLTWNIVAQGPIALAVGAGGGCLDIFSLVYHFFSFSLSLGDGSI